MRLFDGAVTITHEPTGESVTVTNHICRSNHGMRTIADRIIRSRVYAIQHGFARSNKEVANYELPDDNPYPHDLLKYRIRVKQKL